MLLPNFEAQLKLAGLKYEKRRSEWLLPISPPIHTGRFSDFVTATDYNGRSTVFSFNMDGNSEMNGADERFIAEAKKKKSKSY